MTVVLLVFFGIAIVVLSFTPKCDGGKYEEIVQYKPRKSRILAAMEGEE